MEQLRTVMKFVTSTSWKPLPDEQNISDKFYGEKIQLFASLLHQGAFENEEQAIKMLFGNQRHKANFRKMKSRFIEQLINQVLEHNMEKQFKFSYDRSFFHLSRNILAGQILYMLDQRQAGLSLLKPSLNSAIYFHHTQLALQACRFLTSYAAVSGKNKEWKYYSSLFRRLSTLQQAEYEMECMSNEVTQSIVNVTNVNKATLSMISKNYFRAKQLFSKHKSHPITIYFYRMAVRYHHSRNEYHHIISICKKCTAYIEKHPHLYQRPRAGEFALMEMEACMQLYRFRDGMECCHRCKQYFTPHTSPWFVFYEYYFTLAMRTSNYLKAMEIFYNIFPSNTRHKLSDIQIEGWKIKEAWLNFSLPDALPKKQFNLFRFLNEVPLSGRDKAGYNFSVIIAQTILLINTGNFEKLLDIQDALRMYIQRNIKSKRNPRHFAFGKMIRILMRNEYKMEGIEKEISPWLKKLSTKKNAFSKLEETEIIPYEKLWQMLEEKCKAQLEGGKSQVKISFKASMKT